MVMRETANHVSKDVNQDACQSVQGGQSGGARQLGSQGTDRLDRVPRGKEVRARVIESLRSREPAATVGKTPDVVESGVAHPSLCGKS
jgi:hypothetical protein